MTDRDPSDVRRELVEALRVAGYDVEVTASEHVQARRGDAEHLLEVTRKGGRRTRCEPSRVAVYVDGLGDHRATLYVVRDGWCERVIERLRVLEGAR